MSVQRKKKQALGESLGQYLKEISRIPLLTQEEEKELGMRAHRGDETAINKLVEGNLRFVIKTAKRYRGFGVPFQDLINEGNTGLIEAARRFDPSRGVRFISYAIWWIRQAIIAAIADMGHAFRLPLKVNNAISRLGLSGANSRYDSEPRMAPEELAAEFGLSPKEVCHLMDATGQTVSLSYPLNQNQELHLEQVISGKDQTNVETSMVRESVKNCLHRSMETLTEKEERVIKLRFGFHDETCWTLSRVGRSMGLSRERIRQIQQSGLEKLRSDPRNRHLVFSPGSITSSLDPVA